MNDEKKKGESLDTTLSIIKSINDNFATVEETIIESENRQYNVSISTINNICIIILKTEFKVDEKLVEEYIRALNNDNSPMHYSYDNNQIKCKMVTTVDGKITKSLLSNQLSVAIANVNSIMCYLQASIQNG